MSLRAIRMRVEAMRSLAAASIDNVNYTAIGIPFAHIIRILHLTNSTDATLMISFDGVVDHEILLPGTFLLLDITTNASGDEGFYATIGTTMYAKYIDSAPTTGSIYVCTYYGSNN